MIVGTKRCLREADGPVERAELRRPRSLRVESWSPWGPLGRRPCALQEPEEHKRDMVSSDHLIKFFIVMMEINRSMVAGIELGETVFFLKKHQIARCFVSKQWRFPCNRRRGGGGRWCGDIYIYIYIYIPHLRPNTLHKRDMPQYWNDFRIVHFTERYRSRLDGTKKSVDATTPWHKKTTHTWLQQKSVKDVKIGGYWCSTAKGKTVP